MNGKDFNYRMPVALAGLVLLGGIAAADQPPEITISASGLTKAVVGRTANGGPVEEVTLTRRVSYGDLNLAKTADAAELQRRVDQTAKDSCKELDDRYPFEDKQIKDCTKTTVDKAMAQVRAAIAAAEKPH
jgi:UrcA family protein